MAPKSANCDPIEGPAHGSLRFVSGPSGAMRRDLPTAGISGILLDVSKDETAVSGDQQTTRLLPRHEFVRCFKKDRNPRVD